MNRTITTLFIAAVLIAIVAARPAVSQDAEAVETMFRDSIEVAVAPVEVAAAGKVLSSPVFGLRYDLFSGYEGASPYRGVASGDFNAWIKDGQLIPIYGLAELSTDDPLDYLDGLFRPDFRLDADSAEDFMSVLQALMGRDQFESVPVETIQNDGNTWYFVNGDFLSYYKGFIVTVDDDGRIADIEYKLSMLDE